MLEELRQATQHLTKIVVRDCEVWVEGVLWKYRNLNEKAFGE
jgi:hypothetical protein